MVCLEVLKSRPENDANSSQTGLDVDSSLPGVGRFSSGYKPTFQSGAEPMGIVNFETRPRNRRNAVCNEPSNRIINVQRRVKMVKVLVLNAMKRAAGLGNEVM